MGDFSTTILGLAAIGVAGFLAYKFILPKLDLDFMGPGDVQEEPEPYPVYVPSPPQTIIEERLVPISQPPVYVYPPPPPFPIIGGAQFPPFPCSSGRYWNGWECEKIDCPDHYRWKDGRCIPKDCDRDEFWNGHRCQEFPDRPDRDRRRYNPPDWNRPDRDWDREGRDRDRDDETPRPYKRPSNGRPKTNITTLLTPKPKVEEEETDRDVPKTGSNGRDNEEEEDKPKTSPVAALAGFTGRAYEYI